MKLPFERIATTGVQALATWEQLKSAGRGIPVVVGDDKSVGILAIEFDPHPWRPKRLSLVDTLTAAERICHPEDLVAERIRHLADARAALMRHFARHPHGHLPTMSVVDRDGKRQRPRLDRIEHAGMPDGSGRESREDGTSRSASGNPYNVREAVVGSPIKKHGNKRIKMRDPAQPPCARGVIGLISNVTRQARRCRARV